jgi:transposase-like protein
MVKLRRPDVPVEVLEEIARMKQEGYRTAIIARKFDVNPCSVSRAEQTLKYKKRVMRARKEAENTSIQGEEALPVGFQQEVLNYLERTNSLLTRIVIMMAASMRASASEVDEERKTA